MLIGAGLEPKRRLWISSANCYSVFPVEPSLEFAYWTEEPELLKSAENFLVSLMRSSEELGAAPSSYIDPELAPVEFDEAAMAEAVGGRLRSGLRG